MKRLLFFASDFRIGLSAVLTDQLLSIAQSGVEVYAVAGEKEQEEGLAGLLKEHDVNINRIYGLDDHKDFSRVVKEIKQIVLEKEIDVIHVQNNWQLAIAGAVKYSCLFGRKIEIAYTIHGFRNNKPVKAHIAQFVIGGALLLLANHVICMTEYLRSKFRLLSYKIDLIPLGVKENFFTDTFHEPSIDTLHLVFPAQFRVGKNHDMVIRAFSRYVKESHDTYATLTLPGAGDLRNEIVRLIEDKGVKSQVILPGLVSKDEIKKLYLESNVAVVPSNSETFGQSIVEPYVIGRCVVSTPVGIAPEIIENGINGYIFTTEDELYEILCKVSKNKKDLCEIGKNNYSNRGLFAWSEITKKYVEKLKLKYGTKA